MWVFTQPFCHKQDGTQLIFKQCKTGLNSVFLLQDWLPNQAKELNLPYYLPIARKGEIDEFISLPRLFAQIERQRVSPKIWTQFANSISYNNYCYTKHASAVSVNILSYQEDMPLFALLSCNPDNDTWSRCAGIMDSIDYLGIPCLHSADVCKFLLVDQHWYIHMLEFIAKFHLFFLPSSSAQHVLLR